MAAIEAPNFKRGEVKAPKPKPVDLEAKVAPPSYRSFNHLSGRVSSGRLRYTDLYSFAWWRAGDKEAPVRLELSEDTGSLFTEVRIQADYLPSVKRDFGQELSLKAEGRPEETLYHAQISRLENRELTSVGAESMISKLQAFEPESLRLKGPFTPKTALETMLRTWQREAPWLRYEAVPELFVRTPVARGEGSFTVNLGDGLYAPPIGALLLEQPTDLSASKVSAYSWLERFFKLFSEYRFRVNQAGELSVVGPPLAQHLILGFREEPLALSATLYRFEPKDDSDVERNRAREESNTPRARHIFAWGARRVRLWLDVYEVKPDFYHVETYGGESLVAGAESRRETPAGHTVLVRLTESSLTLEIIDTDIARDYRVRGYVEVVEAAPQSTLKRLTNKDVGFGINEVTDFEGVVNRCAVTSQGFEFVQEQELLEPSYVLYRDDNPNLDGKYEEPSSEERKKISSVWSAPEGTIIGAGVLTLAINIELYNSQGFQKGFGIDETLQVGESKRVYVERIGGFVSSTYRLEFYLRYTGQEVQLYNFKRSVDSGADNSGAWIILLNAAGEKFERSNEKIFQLVDESFGSPYGVRRDDIDSGPFPISNETALAIASRRVAEAKEPKTVLSFEQSPRLPVLPDDLHKTLELPDGRRGVVSSWSYAEAHTPQGSVASSRVEVRLEED